MTTVHTPQNPEGARAFPFDAAQLTEAADGYLDAISFLDAAIFMTKELRDQSDYAGYERAIRSLPRLLERARECIDPAGSIAIELEEKAGTPRLWFVPSVAQMPEGGAA